MGPLIRVCAVTAAALVGLSFVLFAADQLTTGSQTQLRDLRNQAGPAQVDVGQPDPPPAAERVREAQHSAVREYVDDADDILLSPFTTVLDSDEIWLQRLVPGVLAVLVYGVGGTLLANAMPRADHKTRDWRGSTG